MDWKAEIQKIPERLQPSILVPDLNAPVEITNKGLRVRAKRDALPCELLDSVFRFVWTPKSNFEFEGVYTGDNLSTNEEESTLFISSFSEEIPIIKTNMTFCESGWKIRGILNGRAVRSTGANVEKLVFHLSNFPDYYGQVIRDESEKAIRTYMGRISFESEQWIGVIDSIPETKHLCEKRKRNGGFYISHVGEIRLKNGQYLNETQIKLICSNLHFLFGFCCGAWAGPFFSQGICENKIVWEELASWKTGSIQEVPSWFPTRTRISELRLFPGFMDKINDPVLGAPLRNAISWYIEANKSEMADGGKIIHMQVALEMLSWAYLVDYRHSFTEKEFSHKGFQADKKIRTLLEMLDICTAIPQHLTELIEFSNTKIEKTIHQDAPGILTYVRNALVHSTEKNRVKASQLNGIHLHQIAQMGIGLIELVILSICKYDGAFARRGWRGWKGEDEIPVPWSKSS